MPALVCAPQVREAAQAVGQYDALVWGLVPAGSGSSAAALVVEALPGHG